LVLTVTKEVTTIPSSTVGIYAGQGVKHCFVSLVRYQAAIEAGQYGSAVPAFEDTIEL
jgi:hypothetical protein